MKCKICKKHSFNSINATLLNKYKIDYFHCKNCGFLQTEEPYWLKEAYSESINICDTGLVSRNLYLSRLTSTIIKIFFDDNSKFLDVGGGYGLLVRLMRDIGFDFYWQDKYSQNILAKGFEHGAVRDYELITAFETFEHFIQPIDEIDHMLNYSDSIFFTTTVLPEQPPVAEQWEYYGLNHGQHISFYSLKCLKYIAGKYNLNLYTDKRNIHLLTTKKINVNFFNLVLKLSILLNPILCMSLQSKMMSDHKILISKQNQK